METNSLYKSKEVKLNQSHNVEALNILNEFVYQDKLIQKLRNLFNIYLSLEIRRKVEIILQFMRIIKDIGMFQNKRGRDNYKVLFSKNNLLNLFLMILKISLVVRNGMHKWVFLIKGVIYFMGLLELVRAHLPKLQLPKSDILSVLSIVQIK